MGSPLITSREKRPIMKTKRLYWPWILAAILICPQKGLCQFMRDIDRKEIGGLERIAPPPAAIELKLYRSFPTIEDEGAGHFLPEPSSFACDPPGGFYIADSKANVIFRFDRLGRFIGQFGRPGQGPGDFMLPLRVAIFDDAIHVHDAGNRRIQNLDLSGRYLGGRRVFKDYCDLAFCRDGSFVGAPLRVESGESDALIEVLASDGKKVRAFGEPLRFAYDQSAMNRRRILINKNDEIVLVFACLPYVRRYSRLGQLLQESRLETPFSFKKETINRRMNSYLPDQKPGKLVVFYDACVRDDKIYLADYVRPRMWIWEIDGDLKITRTFYWTNAEDYMMIRQILPKADNGQMSFIVLGTLSNGGEERVHIFSIK